MTEWNNNFAWPKPELKAKEGCCEEASLNSKEYYIPCNAPATNIVGWKGRSDKPIRMCDFCTSHNVENRGGEIVSFIKQQSWTSSEAGHDHTPWPSQSTNPLDAMSEDQLLMLWSDKKKAIETAKAEEMDLRKYIVGRAFPKPSEGMNTKELGNGYQLKAAVKYNYNLADNDTVENCLARVAALGNQGPFIADRLVSWSPKFLLTEYRSLVEDKEKGDKFAESVLKEITPMLTISEGAPTLEIKEPKAKK